MERCRWSRCRGGRPSRGPARARQPVQRSSACRAATATLLNRQKPIARAGSAWCPGGRCTRGAASGRRRPAAGRRARPRRPPRAAPPPTSPRTTTVSSVDRAAAGRGQLARSRATYRAGCTASRSARATARRLDPLVARASPAALSSSSIATIRAGALGVRSGVVLQRRRMATGRRARPSPVPYPARAASARGRPRRRRRRGRRPVRGADRRPRRRRASRSSRRRRSRETASYWAQGGLAAALARRRQPRAAPRRHDRAGRGAGAPSAAPRALPTRRPTRRRATSSASACTSTPTATATSRSASRAATRAGASSTPAAARPAGASMRQLSALVAEDARHRGPRGPPGGRARASSDGRCVGVVCDDGARRSTRARSILATGGAAALWRRTTNPPGSLGSGLLLARDAGAALADLELDAVPPDRGGRRRPAAREGFLVTEAIRGEGATLLDADGERFVDELAPRDEVARAIEAEDARDRRASVDLDMRDDRPGAVPERRRARCARPASTPSASSCPVAPAAHYMMGGIATDLDGRSTRARPLRGRRVRLHRPARRQPAGLELAQRVLRVRRAAPRCAALAEPAPAAARRRAAGRRPRARPTRPRRETRAALWRHAGLERDAEGLRTLLDDPHPLARLIARCALLREESRGAHQRARLPAARPGARPCTTRVARGDGDEPAFERWALTGRKTDQFW